MYRILVVDDEAEIRALIRLHLERANFTVVEAGSGQEAIEQMQKYRISLMILDLMMDDMNGFEVLQYLQRSDREMLVIALSSRGEVQDKVGTLGLGADDYITKPSSPLELLARVQAQFKRHGLHVPAQSDVIRVNELVLEMDNQVLQVGEKRFHVTEVECKLLQLFMLNPDRVLTKREIYQHVWNHENYDSNNLSVFISRLRSLLGDIVESPLHIKSVRGVGYRFSGNGL